jgi:hypothetical protein
MMAAQAQVSLEITECRNSRTCAWAGVIDDSEVVINLAAPDPRPQRDFMRELRGACWLACHNIPTRVNVGARFRNREARNAGQ